MIGFAMIESQVVVHILRFSSLTRYLYLYPAEELPVKIFVNLSYSCETSKF